MSIAPILLNRTEDTKAKITTSSDNKREWSSVIEEWQQSGLSQTAYCRLHDIKPHIFSYYKNKLTKNKKLDKLVPVQLTKDSQAMHTTSAPGYILHLANGATLTIPFNFESSSLKYLLAVLGVC